MSIESVAERLVDLCRQGKWEQAQKELYHPNVESHEPESSNMAPAQSLDEVFAKNKHWMSLTEEVHSWSVSDPIVADGYFACTMTNDVTLKGVGRIRSSELCVYQVEDGKIVREQFFHAPLNL